MADRPYNMPSIPWKNTFYQGLLPLWGFKQNKAPFSSAHAKPLDSAIQKAFRQNHTVGGSLATFSKGRMTGLSHYGYQRLGGQPVHEHTFFRCASITKLVLAFGALTLVEDHMLDLHQDLSGSFLPSLKNPGFKNKPVSLYHLLNHTSSLIDGPFYAKSLLSSSLPLEQVLAASSSWAPYAPGTAFAYSNLAFGLIGSLIEMVTGKSLENFMQEKVFKPLHMNCTFDITTLDTQHIACNYRVLSKKTRSAALAFDPAQKTGAKPMTLPAPSFHYHHGAGSLYSDAPSLIKVLALFYQEGAPLLSHEVFTQMVAPATSYGKDKPTFFHGLGVAKVMDPTVYPSFLWGHQGFAYGAAQGLFFDPLAQKGFVSLNSGTSLYRRGHLASLSRDFIHLLPTF